MADTLRTITLGRLDEGVSLGLGDALWFKGTGRLLAGDPAGSKDALALMSLWGVGNFVVIYMAALGDVPLSLAQMLPLTGAVVVCTPQEVALLDAIKALRMYQQLNVDILGIVENMSYFVAPDTGKEYDIFGRGGAAKAAERLDVPLLGEIPINIAIRSGGDAGTPSDIFEKVDDTTRSAAEQFVRTLAEKVNRKNSGDAAGLKLRIT